MISRRKIQRGKTKCKLNSSILYPYRISTFYVLFQFTEKLRKKYLTPPATQISPQVER